MNNLEQARELRELANKFSEGWHDGIKIDASDVMLLLNVANALEQRAEPVQAEPVVEPLTLDVSNRLNAEAMALSAAIANLEKLSPDDNSQ
jgi:hypothetical protein